MNKVALKINQTEFEFLTNAWDGAKGAAYNACHEFCVGSDYMTGFDSKGKVLLTERGKGQVAMFAQTKGISLEELAL